MGNIIIDHFQQLRPARAGDEINTRFRVRLIKEIDGISGTMRAKPQI